MKLLSRVCVLRSLRALRFRLGKEVVAGILSPSHDVYVGSKVVKMLPYMWGVHRVRLVEHALNDSGE